MPRRICITQRIIQHITIPVQTLWVGIPWHNGIRTEEAVNIRRIPLPIHAKIMSGAIPALRPIDIRQDSVWKQFCDINVITQLNIQLFNHLPLGRRQHLTSQKIVKVQVNCILALIQVHCYPYQRRIVGRVNYGSGVGHNFIDVSIHLSVGSRNVS